MSRATIAREVIIDEVAIEHAVDGFPVRLTTEERREAVRRLHDRQLSDVSIARQLRIASKTVYRDRKAIGLDQWPGDMQEETR